jgi:hypothetical protein
MLADEARGRLPNGSDLIGMTAPTPGASNLPGGVNTAPVPGSMSAQIANEGELLQFTLSATDAEAPPQVLAFSLINPPSGASVTPTNGVFSWTPDEAQGPSTNLIQFVVTDNGDPALSATGTVTVTVNEVNEAPQGYDEPFTMTVHSGCTIVVDFSATDGDFPAQSISYELIAGGEYGATVNSQTGEMTWDVPPALTGESCTFTVRATDSGNPAAWSEQTVFIDVASELSLDTLSINPSTGKIILRWTAIPGEGYVLQYRSNLLSGAGWENILTITSSTESVVSTNQLLGGSQGFYRVRVIEP